MLKKVFLLFVMLLLFVPTNSGCVCDYGDLGQPVPEEPEITPLDVFMEDIGFFESSGRYDVVNRFGMMGKYQFSPTTVEYLGFDVTQEEFLSNPELQDSVMVAYLRANYRTLSPYLKQFYGETVKGVQITEATLLAGAHFAGAMGVVRFLTTEDPGVEDSNGTTLRYYMNKFSDHNLEL